MNKKIFITYGDKSYAKSLERVCNEARLSSEFDEVVAYTQADLPDTIKTNILFSYKRGGGYWLWKPYVILNTLKNCDDSDIVIYSDCGNKIFKHKQWNIYWKWIRTNNAVFFYNGGLMGQWSRKSLIENYIPFVPMLRKMFQIQSGFIIAKKSAIRIFEEWLGKMLDHPEYVIDADVKLRDKEYPEFIESRHDQAVLSAVVYRYYSDIRVLVTRQRSERFSRSGQAVFNARISDNMVRNPMEYEPFHILIIRYVFVVPYRKFKMSIYRMINKVRF